MVSGLMRIELGINADFASRNFPDFWAFDLSGDF